VEGYSLFVIMLDRRTVCGVDVGRLAASFGLLPQEALSFISR
jgi:hypothetical protein